MSAQGKIEQKQYWQEWKPVSCILYSSLWTVLWCFFLAPLINEFVTSFLPFPMPLFGPGQPLI